MFIPIMIGTALYFTWKKATGIAKTDTSLTLSGNTASASVKLGGTVGVFPPNGGKITNVAPPAPATKTSAIAQAIAPSVATAVDQASVKPAAIAAAVNVTSDMPTTLALVQQQVAPAIAAVVPPPAVDAASNAAAANIVSSTPTTQASLAAAIAPTLQDHVHPDNVEATANAAAANVTSNLQATQATIANTMAPAIAAAIPAVAVPAAADAAATTTMNGEAGSFFLNPRHMQMMTANGEPGNHSIYANRKDNRIYRPEFKQHAYGRGYESTWGAEAAANGVAPKKHSMRGGGKQAVLKPDTSGSWLYTVTWTDAAGATKSTIVNVTVGN